MHIFFLLLFLAFSPKLSTDGGGAMDPNGLQGDNGSCIDPAGGCVANTLAGDDGPYIDPNG